MLRHAMLGLAAVALVGMAFIDDASARARGGGGSGARAGAAAGNRAHVSQPIANRGVAYRNGAYRGAGVAAGAAAVGAAAVGAGYYNNSGSCYRDSYGQLICPNQYQSGY